MAGKPKIIEADIIYLKPGGRIIFRGDGDTIPLALGAENRAREYRSGEGIAILRIEDGVERRLGRVPEV